MKKGEELDPCHPLPHPHSYSRSPSPSPPARVPRLTLETGLPEGLAKAGLVLRVDPGERRRVLLGQPELLQLRVEHGAAHARPARALQHPAHRRHRRHGLAALWPRDTGGTGSADSLRIGIQISY